MIHANDKDDGTFETDTTKFVQIDKLDSVVKVVRGENRNFALKENGSVWFWGEPLKYVHEGLFDSHPQVKTATKFPYADEVINLWGSGDGLFIKKRMEPFGAGKPRIADSQRIMKWLAPNLQANRN